MQCHQIIKLILEKTINIFRKDNTSFQQGTIGYGCNKNTHKRIKNYINIIRVKLHTLQESKHEFMHLEFYMKTVNRQ